MNPLLIVREEIVCLLILLFIVLYCKQYSMGKDKTSFVLICSFAIGHVIFDLITVLTVNGTNAFSVYINRACHIVFYMFALLYSYELLCYISEKCFSKQTLRQIRLYAIVPVILYLAASPLLPIEYCVGDGTKYSFGSAAFVGYGIAMMYFVISIAVVLQYSKKLDTHLKSSLLPMLFAAIAAEIIQIIVPELLFTGGAVTILTVGFFFSMENPVAVLRQKVMTDALTGVKSRHSYEADILQMDRKFASGTQFGMVFCDINDLKYVNDTYGHLEGDSYIGKVAQVLAEQLKSAERLYRMGGDEFLAVYENVGAEQIYRETEAVDAACVDLSLACPYRIGMAIGVAVSDDSFNNLRDLLRMADYRMYSSKAAIKLQRTHRADNKDNLNISGLTDRMFDALACTDPSRFIFCCNMSTNVTHVSLSAVEYFGLKKEYVFDFITLWLTRIHPDDKDAFYDDIMAVFTGKQTFHNMQYRVQDSNGEYVMCKCVGTVLHGKGGDVDLFAGSMQVQSTEDSIDRVTDLRTDYEMMSCLSALIRNRTPAAILELSITNLNRINMLYGYSNGNDILKQFAELMREIVGTQGNIFRSDGTKFVICAPEMTAEDIAEVYRKICIAAEHKLHIYSLNSPLQLAAGAYMLAENFSGSSAVIRSNLIYAHTCSKYDHRGRLQFYNGDNNSLDADNTHSLLLQAVHRDAIAGRQGFFMVYQPIVEVKTGKIVGAEALLRWNSTAFGEVSPGRFIPWLEGDPSFIQLGNWILRTAVTDAAKAIKLQPDFMVNINVALPQLEHEGFRDSVLSILKETEFPPQQLCLELTERCRELEPDSLKAEVEFFRSYGIRVALDDLGTGFSSFGLLLSLNVDEVKLDRTFVREIQTKRVNQILTSMIIEASSSMGYSTCLEGVETDELCAYLDCYGATYYQGYYCMKPERIENFLPRMTEWNNK